MPTRPNKLKTVSVAEAGRRLGLGKSATYLALHAGQLPVIAIAKRKRVPVLALARLIDASGAQAA